MKFLRSLNINLQVGAYNQVSPSAGLLFPSKKLFLFLLRIALHFYTIYMGNKPIFDSVGTLWAQLFMKIKRTVAGFCHISNNYGFSTISFGVYIFVSAQCMSPCSMKHPGSHGGTTFPPYTPHTIINSSRHTFLALQILQSTKDYTS